MQHRKNAVRIGVIFSVLVCLFTFLVEDAAYAAGFFPSQIVTETRPSVLSRYQNQSYTRGVSTTGLIIKFSFVENFSDFVIENTDFVNVTPSADQYSRNQDGTLFLLKPEYLDILPAGKYTMTATFSNARLAASFYVFDQPSAVLMEQPVTVYANNGDNVTFSADVAVTGKDADTTAKEMGITYQWYRASRTGKKKVRGGVSRILQLNEVPDELTGYTYWCEIKVPGYSAPFVTNRVKLYIIGAGDSSGLMAYSLAAALGLTGMVVCLLVGKKRRMMGVKES